MSKTEKRSTEPGVGISRRDFVKRAAMGAGATAALGSTGVRIAAQATMSGSTAGATARSSWSSGTA